MSSLKLAHDGWILVADGEKALYLRNEGDEKYPNLQVFRESHQDNPPTRDQGTDRPGRFPDAGGNHLSGVQETDWHRLEKEQFASEIAEKLYKYAHENAFSQIILVAPPRILASLREEMHRIVADKVVGEVDKDLTNHPVYKIEKIVLGE